MVAMLIGVATYRLPLPKDAPCTIGYTFEGKPHHFLCVLDNKLTVPVNEFIRPIWPDRCYCAVRGRDHIGVGFTGRIVKT
jgi:hypothetical protein